MTEPKPPFPADLWARGAFEDFIWEARGPMEAGWQWGRLADTPEVPAPFNAAQIALWAIWNVDGQIHNGGFVQALVNMHGELAEQAIAGLRLFGMAAQADAMDAGFSCFFRPVPQSADERYARLLAVLEVPAGLSYEETERAISTRSRARVDAAETAYFVARGDLDTYFRTLAGAIEARKDQFFTL